MLDLAPLHAAKLATDPFDHLVVPNILLPEALSSVCKDFPRISRPGNHDLDSLEIGPVFTEFLAALQGPELAEALSEKFGVDLQDKPTTLTIRDRSQPSDGNIHTDTWAKLITIIIYFNPEWEQPGGRLRLLRSAHDLDDYAVEVAPLAGTLVAFRRCDHSYHGYYPFDGKRRMLQFSWLERGPAARLALHMTRFSTRLIKRLGLDRPNPSAGR
jgi:hypothetical protein